MSEWRKLATITQADLQNYKALVWARVRLHPYPERLAYEPYWTDWGVWKGLWYSHRGPPTEQASWGPSYQPMDGNPGAMEITDFMPLPAPPEDAEK